MTHVVRGRWFWTADKSRLVPDGDLEAAFLAYPAGAEIPDGEATRVGLVTVEAEKAARKPRDKMLPAPKNKTIVKDVETNG